MRVEKHLETLREAVDELNSALEDPEGVSKHQRRIALMISLGVATLVEIYFHKLGIMKGGSWIQHQWFKREDVKERLSNQITKPVDSVKDIDKIIEMAKDFEEHRDDLAYGSPLTDEDFLIKKINQFFELKKIVENNVGVLDV